MAYTYLIGWSKHNKFYYGARWSKNCVPTDLWITYFTSSEHVKAFRKKHGDPDIIQVRKLFDNANACKLYERKILEKLNVLHTDKWLNKNINGIFLPTGPQSKDHISKRVASFKRTMNGKGTFSGKQHSNNAKEKNRQAMIGKPKSADHIANMRNRPQDTVILTCQYCCKSGDYKNMLRWHMDNCKMNPLSTILHTKTVTCEKCGFTTTESPNFYKYHQSHCTHVHND